MNVELVKVLGKFETVLNDELYQLSLDDIKAGLEHILRRIKSLLDSLHNNGHESADITSEFLIAGSSVEGLMSSSVGEKYEQADEEKIFFCISMATTAPFRRQLLMNQTIDWWEP